MKKKNVKFVQPSSIVKLIFCSLQGKYNGADVAVKIVFTEKTNRELQIMQQLKHQNVVQLLGSRVNQFVTAIIMELCSYSLETQIGVFKNGLPVLVLHNVLTDVTTGYKYLHGLGIMHNDLKPANILIGTDCKYKITDFGLSVVLRNNQRSSFAAGTPQYCHPSIFRALFRDKIKLDESLKKSSFAPKVEIWSIAVMMYEATTGSLPFQANCPETMFKIMTLKGNDIVRG